MSKHRRVLALMKFLADSLVPRKIFCRLVAFTVFTNPLSNLTIGPVVVVGYMVFQ